jgi:hypothetical protein
MAVNAHIPGNSNHENELTNILSQYGPQFRTALPAIQLPPYGSFAHPIISSPIDKVPPNKPMYLNSPREMD